MVILTMERLKLLEKRFVQKLHCMVKYADQMNSRTNETAIVSFRLE